MKHVSQTNKKEIEDNNYNGNNYQLHIICSADTLRTLIRKNSVRVVDVRKIEDYLQSHIPTAVSLPLSQLLSKDTPEGIIDILQNLGIPDGMPIVTVRLHIWSLGARVAWTFQYVGHINTALLEMTFSQ